MIPRVIVAAFLFGIALLPGGVAHARQLLPAVNPAVLCAPSFEELHHATTRHGVQSLCLLRLSPLFETTSFEVTPQAAKKRWGAELEFRF